MVWLSDLPLSTADGRQQKEAWGRTRANSSPAAKAPVSPSASAGVTWVSLTRAAGNAFPPCSVSCPGSSRPGPSSLVPTL